MGVLSAARANWRIVGRRATGRFRHLSDARSSPTARSCRVARSSRDPGRVCELRRVGVLSWNGDDPAGFLYRPHSDRRWPWSGRTWPVWDAQLAAVAMDRPPFIRNLPMALAGAGVDRQPIWSTQPAPTRRRDRFISGACSDFPSIRRGPGASFQVARGVSAARPVAWRGVVRDGAGCGPGGTVTRSRIENYHGCRRACFGGCGR